MADDVFFPTKWELLVEDVWDDPELKQRLLRDPKTVLKERGIYIRNDVTIKVHENTDRVTHLVLPRGPADGEFADEELEAVAGGGAYAQTCRSCRSCRSCQRSCRSCRGCRP